MSYNQLLSAEIAAGEPVDNALMTKIKENFDYFKQTVEQGGDILKWNFIGDASPYVEINDGLELISFDTESNHTWYTTVVVPVNYEPGTKLVLKGGKFFSNSSAGEVFFKIETSLLRPGQTTADLSSVDTHASTNSAITMTAVNQNKLTDIGELDVTDPAAKINGQNLAAGDVLRIKMFRDNASETSSVADAKLIKDSLYLYTKR